MDKELERYYEDRFSMTGSQGWKDFLVDVNEMIDNVNNILGAKNEQELYFKKGQLDILIWLTRLRDLADSAYKALKDDDAFAKELEDERNASV